MADAFAGEIRIFGFDYAPEYWAWCDGSAVSILQQQLLYALIGTVYGGDGRTYFRLPDLRGCAALGTGEGPGLSPAVLADTAGSETAVLTEAMLPRHDHGFRAAGGPAAAMHDVPRTGDYLSRTLDRSTAPATQVPAFRTGPGAVTVTEIAPGTVLPYGSDNPAPYHENRQPYLVMNFCIALDGEYPVSPD